MRTGAAVLLVATAVVVAGCSSEEGTGPARFGPTPANVVPGGTAAPSITVITPSPAPMPRSVPPAALSSPMQGRGQTALMRKSTPIRVVIPAIGVDSVLMRLGLKRDGQLQVPPNGFPAGWFAGAPTPGERGPAVIAGHVHWAGRPGVFTRLAQLKPGDKIVVPRQDSSAAVFKVSTVKLFPKTTFPSAAVYGNIDHAGLRLITCGGFDRSTAKYEDNVVVFADLTS
jgi:LPXTG-site transpeptidase (sortase) family protein